MADEVQWTNNDEKSEAAREAILALLNATARKGRRYAEAERIDGTAGTKYIVRVGDEPLNLSCRVKVDSDGEFDIRQEGRSSMGTRARRYDDRSVSCDTLEEAYKWVKRRLDTFGKKLDAHLKAEVERKAREAMREVHRTRLQQEWKATVATHLPGAYTRGGSNYDNNEAHIAGGLGAYTPRIMVEAETPYHPDADQPLKATVEVQWEGDPALACQFAARIKAVADELGLTFPAPGRETKPYDQAYLTTEEE